MPLENYNNNGQQFNRHDKAEFNDKSMRFKLLVIVIIDFRRYLSSYFLMHGSCLFNL